jgi:hypothetical protein
MGVATPYQERNTTQLVEYVIATQRREGDGDADTGPK